MFFWKKKPNSEEYDTLNLRIRKLESSVENLETRINLQRTDLNNLRGNFNRKLAGLSKEEEKVEPKEEEKPQNLNKGGPIVFTGMTYGNIPK